MPLVGARLSLGTPSCGCWGLGGWARSDLAQHPRSPRRDAIKILGNDVSADDDYRQRFIREADLAAKLWHPNIVRVNDRGEFEGQLWIAMDFVDGADAAGLLRDRYPAGMSVDEVVAIIAAIAGALDYAHQHDLLHRDVKPANILLTNSADSDQRILLEDFGIARTIGDISGLTATNMTIGTLPYAAPEQLTDEPIDGRADQYALAATAFHLLTGSPLFPHSNPAVVISRHLSAPPPLLADTRPQLTALDPVRAVALTKDPADRFARCADFARAFAQAAQSGRHATASAATMQAPLAGRPSESTGVPADEAGVDKQQRRRRHRILLAATITVIALTAIGVIGYTIEKNNTASKPTPPAAVLNGTYRVVYDFTKRTVNGAPSLPPPNTDTVAWWAFRSLCTSTGCTAAVAGLNKSNPQILGAKDAVNSYRFADGHWQETPSRHQVNYDRCLGENGTILAGTRTEFDTKSLEPQPDGTQRGLDTVTILTNELASRGR
jgi:serine/threonine protein kinase, bacterial